jgi:hypothetical protein
MLVFASENYDPNDYIREYNEFLKIKIRPLIIRNEKYAM